MNKLMTLPLLTPLLFFSTASAEEAIEVVADKEVIGWWRTPDGKDATLNGVKLISDVEKNRVALVEMDKREKQRMLIPTNAIIGATGAKGDKGARGHTGLAGATGGVGDKGMKGDAGARGLAGESFYAGKYGGLDLISAIAMTNATANIPTPTSDGFFVGFGFSDSVGKSANAIGIHYVDDVFSYKMTYGHSHHDRSIGLGVGMRL